MPQERQATRTIPKIYKFQAVDNQMFGYVTCMRRVIPSTTITKAIEWFMRDFDLSEDEYPLDTAKVIYDRVFKSYIVNSQTVNV